MKKTMTTKTTILTIYIFFAIGLLHAEAATQNASIAVAPKCNSTPCGNTTTGEDPQEQRIREGNIWRAAVSEKDAHMPHATPTPSLKIISNGYRFDWSGLFPSDNKPSKMVLHNSYTRVFEKSGASGLLCTDLSAPKGEGVEDEMCEGVLCR